MKKKSYKFIGDENGSAIVIALLVLLALSIIGIATMTTSQFETQVATNDILSKKAFYAADGGVEITREMIEECISCGIGFPSTATGITTGGDLKFEQTESFLRVTNLDFAFQNVAAIDNMGNSDGTLQASEALPSDTNKDLWFGDNFYTINDYDTVTDGEITTADVAGLNLPHTNVLAFGDTAFSTGSAIQMIAGYEGVGKALASGGGQIGYQIHSRHENPARNSEAYIVTIYRHLIGQEGNCKF